MEREPVRVVKRQVTVPAFNSDSAYSFIQKQVDFGPRVPNTNSHDSCGLYLENMLIKFGAKVLLQEFSARAYDGSILRLKNIIASYNIYSTKRILLATHWDTRPFADGDTENRDQPIDGANDGGSGVGVLMEVARQLGTNDLPNVGVDIIFFDGEDYGEHQDMNFSPTLNGRAQVWWCLGSQYWSYKPHLPRYSAYYGVLLDMVGSRDAQFWREGGSMQFAPKVTKSVWKTARGLGYGHYFINKNSPAITDDHIFVNHNARIPMVAIVDYSPSKNSYYFGDYHHTHNDNMSLINKQTLQAVGETMLFVVYNE